MVGLEYIKWNDTHSLFLKKQRCTTYQTAKSNYKHKLIIKFIAAFILTDLWPLKDDENQINNWIIA